jgi:hypothetical protein
MVIAMLTLQAILGASIQAAAVLSSYVLPPDQPKIVSMPHEAICTMVTKQPYCAVKGYYDKGTIYLDKDVADSAMAEDQIALSIVVHEATHFLQDKAGLVGRSCSQWLQNEKEAFEIQRMWLRMHNNYYPAGQSLQRGAYRCET